MEMDTLTGKMGCTPILGVKVSIEKIKSAAHKNGDIDCKRSVYTNRQCHSFWYHLKMRLRSKVSLIEMVTLPVRVNEALRRCFDGD